MDSIVVIIVLLLIVYAIHNEGFKAGKRLGSRKGYGVGYDRGRRSKSGCLVVVVAACLALAGATIAVAKVLF